MTDGPADRHTDVTCEWNGRLFQKLAPETGKARLLCWCCGAECLNWIGNPCRRMIEK